MLYAVYCHVPCPSVLLLVRPQIGFFTTTGPCCLSLGCLGPPGVSHPKGSKSLQEASRSREEAPRGSKMPPRASKMRPNAREPPQDPQNPSRTDGKKSLSVFKYVHTSASVRAKMSQDTRRRPQDTPETPQKTPKTFQDALWAPPRRPKTLPGGPKDTPKGRQIQIRERMSSRQGSQRPLGA